MSSKSILRNKSLESGVTPRRLNQVVLPDPGSPMVSTTKPLWLLAAAASGGGVERSSGWVSTSSLPSGSWVSKACASRFQAMAAGPLAAEILHILDRRLVPRSISGAATPEAGFTSLLPPAPLSGRDGRQGTA